MITSKDNNTIKLCQKIKNKKYSRECGLCFVETYKVIKELYNSNLLDVILVNHDKLHLFDNFNNIKIETISSELCEFLSDTSTNDGVFAICKIPENKNIDYSKCIILDNIQDPSNIGAIIRSAKAFGYNTILSINSVYPYTYKCIRSSMSYIFSVNYIDISYSQLENIKKDKDLTIVTADMNGENIDNFHKNFNNFAIVIGNEGNGISDSVIKLSDKVVSIPMDNSVESLNASISASILMYLLK